MAGIWFLQGTSSTRGPYNGELELRPSNDGTFDAIRIVTYINYFYDGLRVQEVWQGKAIADNDTLTVSYQLRQGEFITKLDDTSKSAKELRTPITLDMRYLPTSNGLAAKFSDGKVSEYSEWLTTSRPLEAQPLWANSQRIITVRSKPIPAAERRKIRDAQRILEYFKEPFVQSYKNRPEFKNEQVEIVVDNGDVEFYKNQKDIIRLISKITDDATIAESVLKQNAYMPSLKEKALRYDDSTSKKNFSQTNLVVVRKSVKDSSFHAFAQDTDAAFTTGMYLASQAMRYKVTQDEKALQNMKRAMLGLRGLADISKGTAVVASVVAPVTENPLEGWTVGPGAYQNLMWTAGNQEQSILGIMHGLTWASVTVPRKEADLWMNLQETLKELNTKEMHSTLSKNTLFGLNALVLGSDEAQNSFTKSAPPAQSFYWAGNADWTKEFQTLIETINHIHLATALRNTILLGQWQRYLMDEWQVYAPIHPTLRTFATRSFGSQTGTLDLSGAVTEAARALSEIPYPRPRMNARIDHSGDPAWTVSPIPRDYWTITKKTYKSPQNYYQGLRQVPLYELLAVSSPFIWREDAFQYQGRSNKDLEASGVDYLYAYWLARLGSISETQ